MRGEPVGDGAKRGGNDERADVLLRPGFKWCFVAVLLIYPPGFGQAWEIEEAEIVEVDREPLRFLFEGTFVVESECTNVVFRGVNGLPACHPQNVACEG